MSVSDRVAAIHFLGMLYARARASDTKLIHEILVDKPHATWEHAFIEMSTLHHKTARLDSQKRRLLPLVMPASGIAEVDFGDLSISRMGDIKMVAGSFAEARTSAGLDFSFFEGDYLDMVL